MYPWPVPLSCVSGKCLALNPSVLYFPRQRAEHFGNDVARRTEPKLHCDADADEFAVLLEKPILPIDAAESVTAFPGTPTSRCGWVGEVPAKKATSMAAAKNCMSANACLQTATATTKSCSTLLAGTA